MAAKTGFAKYIIVITTVSAAIMELLDTTIVNVALNQMAGSLSSTIEDVAWVITSYAIANVIIIPMTGFLGEYFGRKTYYLTSMVLFGVASYFCGASEGLWELVFWRFIQGIGGGALLSTSQAILFDAFDPKDRGVASGLFGMGIVLGPTLGPALGGYILEHYTWSQIFYVNIPICVIATILTIIYIERKEGEGERKSEIQIDYIGIALLVIGIGALQFVLEKGESEDWFQSRMIVTLSIVAAIGILGFIWQETHTEHPVVNLGVFKYKIFAFSTIFTLIAGVGLFTSSFVYPVLVQRVNGFTPYEAGLSLVAPTLAAVILFPIIGKRMAAGAPPIPFMVAGILFFVFFGFYSGTATPDMGRWDFFPMQLCRTVGISLLQLPLINQAVAGLKPKEYPAGIALSNMIRQLGGAFGIALANNFATNRAAQHRSDLMANMSTDNPLFNERLANMTRNMAGLTGDTFNAATMAYKQMEAGVVRQAYYLAYLDTFRLIAVFFVCLLPFVYLLKTKKLTAEEVAEMAKATAESH
ncbi:DHA2 family efflux MFS transporter permease subunit [Arcicella rigui]|uniref:DHA2 family efflux MFS transporter permease subunit n=1 Tax=Arcicella rigui TaxID=797020 RepID=A0ABU5Q8Q0_9BACT|nr:DHA2 family efflux MFS transporter permease subunit [Arcicella rigui]MEA5139214.1 DHA2 family efflux MFS transporter permease subunit [Arcicella rigui]